MTFAVTIRSKRVLKTITAGCIDTDLHPQVEVTPASQANLSSRSHTCIMQCGSCSLKPAVTTLIGVLPAIYAATFFLGALLHLGVEVPLGLAVLDEPRILPATIVEGLCGLALAVAALAVFAPVNRAWTFALTVHAFALGGVLLGITALAVGAGPSTELNTIYHRVIVVALVAVLALLLSPAGRTALRRTTSPTVIQSG